MLLGQMFIQFNAVAHFQKPMWCYIVHIIIISSLLNPVRIICLYILTLLQMEYDYSVLMGHDATQIYTKSLKRDYNLIKNKIYLVLIKV